MAPYNNNRGAGTIGRGDRVFNNNRVFGETENGRFLLIRNLPLKMLEYYCIVFLRLSAPSHR